MIKKAFFFLMDRVPFLGTRFWCAGIKAHKMAIREFLFVSIMSTAPLWLGAILLIGIDKKFKLTSLLKDGELFLYCTAVLAGIAWINIKTSLDGENNSESQTPTAEPSNADTPSIHHQRIYPPDKYWFWLIVIIGLMVCVPFYALNLAKAKVDPDYVFNLSLWIYSACLFFYHNILVSQYSLEYFKPFQETSAEHTQQFLDGYAAHRGQV